MWGLLEWAPGASGGCRGRLSLVYGGNILGHFTTWLGGPGMALQLLSSGRNVLFSLALAGPAETGLARPLPIWLSFYMFVGITSAPRSVRGFHGRGGVCVF